TEPITSTFARSCLLRVAAMPALAMAEIRIIHITNPPSRKYSIMTVLLLGDGLLPPPGAVIAMVVPSRYGCISCADHVGPSGAPDRGRAWCPVFRTSLGTEPQAQGSIGPHRGE